jgi:hypothetical protein
VNWFKKHLNLTWLFGALLVVFIATSIKVFFGHGVLEGNNAAYFFIWCMLPLNAWILRQKGRNLNWLWLAFFFVPYITLILGNKKQSSHNQKTLSPPDNKGDKINKQKKEGRTKQKITPKPFKLNRPSYILGIVFLTFPPKTVTP